MRRLIFITAFALLFAVPLWAQRGGGHSGGGHTGFGGAGHGGFAGGHGGFGGGHGGFSGSHAGGGHFSGGMHGGFSHGFNRPSRSGFSRVPYLHNGFHNGARNGFHGRHSGDRDRFHFGLRTSNCFGFACRGGFPWWGWGYDPWLWNWWDDHSSYSDDYNENLAIANEMNQQSLEQQRMLRQEEADGDQDAYSRPSSASNSNSSAKDPPDPILPATVLVFRDQRQQEIHNYAIVGQTLWNFAPQHTQKIPLADLDIAATEKANDDRGVTFRVPSSGEAQ